MKRKYMAVVICLAAVVVFCTAYALILPAVALEEDSPKCGIEDHTHDASCYEETSTVAAPLLDSEQSVWNELASQGIYKGTKIIEGGREVWTVYDKAEEASANVKATVTLPENTFSQDGYYLYIRPVEENEGYYPTKETLESMAGTINEGGVQCYAIHWVRVYQEGGEWKYDVQTESVLGEGTEATVEIQYLKEEACLKGHQANRKLQVYNSRNEEGTSLENASTPTAVAADAEAYTGFTFTTDRGGPYVFVSKYLYEGYVTSLSVDSVIDGTAPFDSDDDAGNDFGEHNSIVRSYDAIQYDLTVNFGARSSLSTTTEGRLGFEMVMEADVTEAVFDTSKMRWMGEDYTIEYLDQEGHVILRQEADGRYIDANGKETSLNDIVSDSTYGTDSYSSGIVHQRLRAERQVSASQNLLAGNQTLSASVQVLGADDQKIIQPTFKAWFVGNEENYGSESVGEGTDVTLAQKVTDNEKPADPVTVSAAARFNLELAKNNNMSYKSWFDSSKGTEVSKASDYTIGNTTVTGGQMYTLLEKLAVLEENIDKAKPEKFTDKEGVCSEYLNGRSLEEYEPVFQNIRYGRITGYGVILQVYNKASDSQNTASKGFKGITLPQGEASFNLEMKSSVKVSEGIAEPTQYYSQLWEYNENINAGAGRQDKNMYWAELASTKYAAWAAPYNRGDDPENVSCCYAGGEWNLNSENGEKFTVSGYDFNFLSSGLKFPTHKAGNSSETTGYNTYIGSYSAGYVQVLNVFPRYQAGTINMSTEVIVRDLEVTTTDGNTVSPSPGDETGYAHEINTRDNSLSDDIPLYARGGMTKANAFDSAALYDKDEANFSSKEYFLGSDFWGTSYDCSAYAGQDITLTGAFRIGAGDYQIRHANVLQLFDSEALSLKRGQEPKVVSLVANAVRGDTNILYAADPDHPKGYDTNKKDVMKYMSTVREEDLIYYESLDALEDAGFVCVGIMAELRNWAINGEGGYATFLKIPMTVSQDEKFLGKTVGTVNSVRIWTNVEAMGNGSVSWKNGENDPKKDKNSVAGYTSVSHSSDNNYCGEVANGSGYEKTEYENGQIKLGTNTGGYVQGSSLLILNYKSEVDIGVENKSGAQPSYDLDKGEYTVNYRLQDIIAKTDETIGSAQDTHTNLTILAKLDTPRSADTGSDQRIAVAADSYSIKPASDKMVLTDAQGNILTEQSVKISSDPDLPTTVYYAFVDDAGAVIPDQKYEIQIYAQKETKGTQITFEISHATIGVSLPDITFDALIDPDEVSNNDTIQTTAYIKGTSDVRAYSETNGNMDTTGIGIIQLGGTRLVKAVDKEYIELKGTFNYTVTYTNRGQEPIDLYLYDLLPDNGDIRNSKYAGAVVPGKVAAHLSGEGDFNAQIQFYYSKIPYKQLYDMVRVFGGNTDGTGKNQENIENMLSDESCFSPLGTISSDTKGKFQPSGNLSGMSEDELIEEMRNMTGIYAVVKGLGGGKSLTIELTMGTDGNKSGNLYRNIANSWMGGTDEPLTSNLVETSVLSRTISGVVWDDADFDGVRDADEKLIPGVTCTLFRMDEDTTSGTYGQYILCKEDVTGAKIQTVTTGQDGAYSFEKLAAGKYIVAFSGDALKGTKEKRYVGATTYQVNHANDNATNDAVALTSTKGKMDTETAIAGIDGSQYSYAIAYSFDPEKKMAGATPLHTIDEILQGISLVNNVELHENLDLGLVTASYELPKTGGSGTILYRAGGLLLVGISLLLVYRKKKYGKECKI